MLVPIARYEEVVSEFGGANKIWVITRKLIHTLGEGFVRVPTTQ
jgi:hypothetical protein